MSETMATSTRAGRGNDFEPIAKALAEWRSDRRWEEMTDRARQHWLAIAYVIQCDKEVCDLIVARKRELRNVPNEAVA